MQSLGDVLEIEENLQGDDGVKIQELGFDFPASTPKGGSSLDFSFGFHGIGSECKREAQKTPIVGKWEACRNLGRFGKLGGAWKPFAGTDAEVWESFVCFFGSVLFIQTAGRKSGGGAMLGTKEYMTLCFLVAHVGKRRTKWSCLVLVQERCWRRIIV